MGHISSEYTETKIVGLFVFYSIIQSGKGLLCLRPAQAIHSHKISRSASDETLHLCMLLSIKMVMKMVMYELNSSLTNVTKCALNASAGC